MKINSYNFPKSSFLSLEKDLSLIVSMLLKNERLKKLLFYNTKDALLQPNLTQQQTIGLLNKELKIIPKIRIDNETTTYIIINFDNFSPSSNPEFRDNDIIFDIICHVDQWQLNDFQLRPYKIAGEIDSMLNGAKLTGIGTLEFTMATQQVIDANYALITLMYHAVHGGEDSEGIVNPVEEAQFLEYFDELFNS